MGVSPLGVTLVVSHLQELTLGPEVAENMHYKRNRRNTCRTRSRDPTAETKKRRREEDERRPSLGALALSRALHDHVGAEARVRTIDREHCATLSACTATRSRRWHTCYTIRRVHLNSRGSVARRRQRLMLRPCNRRNRRNVPMDGWDRLANLPIRPSINRIDLRATPSHHL